MTFAAPLWLIGLAPLAAVVLYLLWGRRRQESVPFLDLWLGPVEGPRPRRHVAAPPLALALAILAMLLAVVGAARPAVWDQRGGTPFTTVFDRGATMAAKGRLTDISAAAWEVMKRSAAMSKVDVLALPGGTPHGTDVSDWTDAANQVTPTAADTANLLRATVARRLAETSGPVVVITDRELGTTDERAVRVSPASAVSNVGITLLAARQTPVAQVMVRVRNDSATGGTELRVSSAGAEVVRMVDLPPRGQTRDYFVDLAGLADTVKAELRVEDDFAADNAAWLVREGGPPRIEPRDALPTELRRMIDVYASARRPAEDAARVAVVRDVASLPQGASGVVVAAGHDAVEVADVRVTPHPVTRETHWTFHEPVRLAAAPGPQWAPVVMVGGRVAVAVREAPARQVWVGLESDEWPRTPDYVVFWGNVFDWLGGGETRFVSHPVARMEGSWERVDGPAGGPSVATEPGLWPGLYRRAEDGALRAVNVGEVRFPTPPAQDWRPRLAEVLSRQSAGASTPLSGGVLVASAACAALAAMSWKRRSLTAFSGRRTVTNAS